MIHKARITQVKCMQTISMLKSFLIACHTKTAAGQVSVKLV